MNNRGSLVRAGEFMWFAILEGRLFLLDECMYVFPYMMMCLFLVVRIREEYLFLGKSSSWTWTWT